MIEMRRLTVLVLTAFALGAAASWFLRSQVRRTQSGTRQYTEFTIIEFHGEGEPDGFCYVTAQLG
jgi:hypothetical protein